MQHLSPLLIVLTVSLSTLGSIIQDSHSLEKSARFLSKDGGNEDLEISASEVVYHSESDGNSEESSGHTGDGTALKLISQDILHGGSEQARKANPSAPEILSTKATTFSLYPSGPHDPRADKSSATITGYAHSREHFISDEAHFGGRRFTAEEQWRQRHSSRVNEDFLHAFNSPDHPLQNNVFTSLTKPDFSGPRVSCVLGRCVVSTSLNGTNLLWDDMRRTLAFAWELHVFGSASLFMLIAGLAVVGMAGACTRPRPFCDALISANCLLILSGTLRAVLLLLDPYGTCQVLSRATLAALHNAPLQLLLWAQVALALVTLRGLNLMLFPLNLQQHPWVVGVLAISVCTSLFLADLFSPTLSPALPLLLQTFSLCWGLPFCTVILVKSFSRLHSFLRSSVPQWVPSQRIERRAKRVTAVCALLGVLCCSLQMYSLLWLYGLLGNWRRFSWGWWLSQFWARIFEVSWGFSLLVLGSWIFWTPSMVQSRGDSGQFTSKPSKTMDQNNLLSSFLVHIHNGTFKKPEKSWEDLIPSNWTKYNLSRAGFNDKAMCPYDDPLSTIKAEYKPDPGCNNSAYDSQAALLWQKQVNERDCILSLIEFDVSNVNFGCNSDDTRHDGQLVDRGLFTPQPPSWTETVGRDVGATTFSTDCSGYRWTMDTELKEPAQPPCAAGYCNSGVWFQAPAQWIEELNSSGMYLQDWSDDDVTDL
ncbi:uncharacterized protein LOC109990288 [Xyrichtys novacula]|uniref:Uncharacterized protein LOC109990288 n=1 Tax=Xyrichtys novacula TaxID=13765 RepID=A0AAV1ETF4_XYRNO|nr:uncharacterized protein LOC109990288 [Xyrichtys novacula]